VECIETILTNINKLMSNEFKKQCGAGQYWCNTDKVCKPLQEDGMAGGAPTNAVGGGQIAGIGIPPQGEPGVKKKKIASFISYMSRKMPK
jgi:hypothetical protein